MNQRAGCHEHPAKFFTKKCYIRSIARSKMTKSQKEINDVMVQVLEEVIFPRFDQVDEKIQSVDVKVETLKRRVGDLDKKVDALDEKAEVLDEKVDYTNRRLDVLVDWAGFVVN